MQTPVSRRLATLAVSGMALAASAAASAPTAHAAAAPEGLTVEQAVRPLDVDVERPRLAWQVPVDHRGIAQSAYEVEVATDPEELAAGRADAWDSGKVRSGRSIEIPYGGEGLTSGSAYWWRVRYWDENGAASPWSAATRFETGFLRAGDWKGRWIGRGNSAPERLSAITPAPEFRKEFSLGAPVRSARLRIAGLGVNEVEVNGEKVGDHVLDPAQTTYDRTALYETFDVTKALRSGGNAVGVTLGRGYFAYPDPETAAAEQFRWWAASWNSEQKLIAQIDVELTDGTRARVVSDGSWTVDDSATVGDDVDLGEAYDAREEEAGWSEHGFDDSSWQAATVVDSPGGLLRAQTIDPRRVTDTLEPVEVTQPRPGVWVYDFGGQRSGWARVRVRGAAGTAVKMLHGERVDANGLVIPRGDIHGGTPDQQQVNTYVLKGGGAETWEPRFSYHGFRYVQVSGSPALPQVQSVQARVVHTDVADNGGFDSSSKLYNDLHAAMRRTTLNNLQGIPLDTPTFDKAGWTADGHLYSDSALRNFDTARFFEKWMTDHADAQKADGSLGVVIPTAPTSAYVNAIGPDPLWVSSYMLVNWDLYQYEGNVATLRRNYDGMRRLLAAMQTKLAANGGIWNSFSFGDWVPPDPIITGMMPPEGWRLSETAAVIQTARAFADVARVLGRGGDAADALAFADRVRDDFNAEFLDTQAGIYIDRRAPTSAGYRQTANLQALAFGIVPPEHHAAVLANLVRDIRERRGSHMWVGAVGTKLILPVLTENGYGDLANTIASQTTFPSWGHMLALGHDTLLEEYSGTIRSLNHPFLGTVEDWLVNDLAGLEVGTPGYAKSVIDPIVVTGVDHASAYVDTPHGRVETSWQRAGDGLDLHVEVPGNATAEVRLPAADAASARVVGDQAGATFLRHENAAAVYAVGAGSYRFHADRITPPTPVDPPRPPVEQPRPPVEQPGPPMTRRPTTTVRATAAKTVRLAGLTGKGLVVKVTVPQRAKLALTFSAKLPRSKRMTTFARLSRSTTKATTLRLRLKVGRAAARKLHFALASRRSVTANVTVKTTVGGSKPTTKTLRVTIRR